MKKLLPGVAVCVVVAVVLASVGRTQQPNNVSDFMRLKLNHSKDVLEGIVQEDFDKIAKNSQAMSLLSQAATWQVLQTPEYLQHSAEFRRTADALTRAAKEKNVDAAALAYMELTMKCVNCHKYVRGVRIARAHRPQAPAFGGN
jgi:hypothetical protein